MQEIDLRPYLDGILIAKRWLLQAQLDGDSQVVIDCYQRLVDQAVENCKKVMRGEDVLRSL